MIDGVTINQLRAFVAVCDEGSFSAAARALGRAQSAISHAVASLEDALRVELFERDARRAELSAAGRSLLPDARAVIARTEEMKTRAGAIARLGAPRVSLAVDVHFPRAHLIDCLAKLQAQVPTAAIDLRTTTGQAGEALVLAGACALAVTVANEPEASPDGIERHWLAEVPVTTVCAPTHPLAGQSQPLPPEAFDRQVELVISDGSVEEGGMGRPGAKDRTWMLNDLSAKHDFLLAGLCWGEMPTHLVRQDLAEGRLIELMREDRRAAPLTFAISRKRGHDMSPSEAMLVDLLAAAGAYCRAAEAERDRLAA